VLAGGGNLMEGPCANVPLVLQNSKAGSEIARARTESNGEFAFEAPAESGLSLKIDAGSRFYEVAEPTQPVQVGQTIELKLRVK
jgi:hypothetical protein